MGVDDDYLFELERRRDHYRQRLRETLDEIERRKRGLEEVSDLPAEERRRRMHGLGVVPAVLAAVEWVKGNTAPIVAIGLSMAVVAPSPGGFEQPVVPPAISQGKPPETSVPLPTTQPTATVEPTDPEADDSPEPPDENESRPDETLADSADVVPVEPPQVVATEHPTTTEPQSDITAEPTPEPNPSPSPIEIPIDDDELVNSSEVCADLDVQLVAELEVCTEDLLSGLELR